MMFSMGLFTFIFHKLPGTLEEWQLSKIFCDCLFYVLKTTIRGNPLNFIQIFDKFSVSGYYNEYSPSISNFVWKEFSSTATDRRQVQSEETSSASGKHVLNVVVTGIRMSHHMLYFN